MHGAGNDFVVIDDRNGAFPWSDIDFIRRIASRRTGIGCDGILLVQPSEQADFRMRFLNPDGGEVSMCGNGARCFARFVHERLKGAQKLQIETGAGIVQADVSGSNIQLKLTEPKDLRLGVDLESWAMDSVDTGVPHAVVWVDDVASVDLPLEGREIREHAHFAPEGTNVDWVQVEADGSLKMRTYERGVEAETMACGTGAAAVALVAAARGRVKLPVAVHCAGGFDLVIGSEHGSVMLAGGAEYVFEGEIEYGDRI